MVNALTIDFEDWFCADNLSSAIKFEDWEKCELRITDNTLRILELLDRFNAKATFFVLGWIAERVPELIEKIDSNGHEIASHGYSHISLTRMTREEFDKDLKKALTIKKNIIDKEILGYRSPSFSITPKTVWALDILVSNGIKYDSSIFPFSFHPDYGFPGTPTGIHNPRESLTEIPLSVVDIWGFKIPFGGGGYFRLYPYFVTKYLMSHFNRKGKPFVFYLHPWEIDIGQPLLKISHFKKFRHYFNLKKTYSRFADVLSQYRFSTIKEIYFNNKMNEFEILLRGFLDKDFKLKVWPSKPEKKRLALAYLAEKFEAERIYSEKEVNEIIKSNHTFNDHPLLRRELFDRGFLDRTPNGMKYWKKKDL